MHNFLTTLSFSLIPMTAASFFSLVTPPLGATLSLRNEILLGIALPQVGSAVIAAALFCGVAAESTLLLTCLAGCAIFVVMLFLPLNVGKQRICLRQRELILAGLFCVGSTATMLFTALSPVVEAHFRNLLQGEILAVTQTDLVIAATMSVIIIICGLRLRGFLYAYSLDEESLKIKHRTYRYVTVLYRAYATLVITGGIILIGPLLTTSLLVVPALCIERVSKGLDYFLLATILIGLSGTVSGFFAAIITDLPPAALCVSGILVIGSVYYCLKRRFV
ncbi:MAG: metal ABC transporter permease [Chitinivibrionales bacterium]|nr:metal ABC transporter permease [Chitinivibrionales bacterium]